MESPIIRSLLDTDLYKFTMQQSMFRRYGDVHARMAFHCRAEEPLLVCADEVREQCAALGELQLTREELDWLSSLPFIRPEFIDYLRTFRLNPEQLSIWHDDQGNLHIEAEGKWAEITHFEIFVLALVSEIHCRKNKDSGEVAGERLLKDKLAYLKDSLAADEDSSFRMVDFGTRRRYSRAWQARVVERLGQELPGVFVGTSNMHLARTLGLKPVGTMAHEWLQSHQALGDSLLSFQKEALAVWLEEYGSQLGIALTDTISMQAFLRDFDKDMANAYWGIRHDSGDPIHWGEQALEHYRRLGIDAREKQLVFSDKLDFVTALNIHRHFAGKVNVSFGIGTYLTNDMGVKAPNIVMKLIEVNGRPVAKLSDNPGKTMCRDKDYIKHLKKTFAYS